MADAKNYPDEWRLYQGLVRSGQIIGLPKWGVFAARYRVASDFSGASFYNLRGKIIDGYNVGIKHILCYSAFEAACAAAEKDTKTVKIPCEHGFPLEARKRLISIYKNSTSGDFPLIDQINSKLLRKIDAFLDGSDSNCQPIAAALRHLFAHGVWTPTGGEILTKKAREAIDLLSQTVLIACDNQLNAYLAEVAPESIKN
jgi:hypothetical protein